MIMPEDLLYEDEELVNLFSRAGFENSAIVLDHKGSFIEVNKITCKK